MFNDQMGWLRDVLLRGAGLCLLGGYWLLMNWLFRSTELRHHDDPTMIEIAAAAAGFVCFSAGAALASLGEHIFDRVEVAERWARRSSETELALSRLPPPFGGMPDRNLVADLSAKPLDRFSGARAAARPAGRTNAHR